MYGIIAETKIEGPLIWESKPLSYEEAQKKMRLMYNDQRFIRVAVFSLQYETGNETLIQKDED